MSEYGKDFIWMQRQGEEPVKVAADPAVISQSMVAGFTQVDPPNQKKEKE